MVDRRRVAKVVPEIRTHGIEHLRQNRRGGVIVEVNAQHAMSILSALRRRLKSRSILWALRRGGEPADNRGARAKPQRLKPPRCAPSTALLKSDPSRAR